MAASIKIGVIFLGIYFLISNINCELEVAEILDDDTCANRNDTVQEFMDEAFKNTTNVVSFFQYFWNSCM